MKIPKVSYVRFKSKRNFGVELEVNEHIRPADLVTAVKKIDKEHPVLQSGHYVQDYNNSYWHVKFDRSCGDVRGNGGWEVASYKAKGWKDLDNICKVVSELKTAGAKINDECGMHVHVEIADYPHSQAGILVANWLKIEPVILEILPKHRRNNTYAKPLRSKLSSEIRGVHFGRAMDGSYFWETIRPKRFDNPNRRVSLNMCNYAQWVEGRKTVELRLPEGTLEAKEVKNWVRLFLTFVDFSKKREFPKDIDAVGVYEAMKIMGLHSEDPFFILSKGLRDTKIWFMKRILAYSGKKKYREEAEIFLNALEAKSKEPVPEKVKIEEVPFVKPVRLKPAMVTSGYVFHNDSDRYEKEAFKKYLTDALNNSKLSSLQSES